MAGSYTKDHLIWSIKPIETLFCVQFEYQIHGHLLFDTSADSAFVLGPLLLFPQRSAKEEKTLETQAVCRALFPNSMLQH
jgi:hypothetical protein